MTAAGRERAQEAAERRAAATTVVDDPDVTALPIAPLLSDSSLNATINGLNQKQRELFDMVLEKLDERASMLANYKADEIIDINEYRSIFISGVGECFQTLVDHSSC